MKCIYIYVTLLALSAILASCGSDNDPQANLATAVTKPSFAAVTDAGGAVSIVPDVSCSVAFDDQDMTALVVMANQGWSPTEQGSVLRFKDLEWVFDGLARRMTTTSAAPERLQAPVLSDIRMLYQAPCEISGRMADGLAVSFAVDGRRVTFIPIHALLSGTTESVVIGDPVEAMVSTETVYDVTVDPSSLTASVIIRNPQYDLYRRMASPDMELRALPVILTEDGYTVSAPAATPYVDDVPQLDYEIRDLRLDVSLFGQSVLSYVTAAGYSVEAYFEAVYMP